MNKPIFKNLEHQALFEKQGFIVLPFLNEAEVASLDLLFNDLHPNLNQSGFFSGSYSNDIQYKKNASQKIVEKFNRAYQETFINYTPFGGAFLYKVPGQNSELAAHQDWTIVDEQQNVALNCWIPLCDVTKENGALMILPGSHFDNFNVVRAPTLPFFFSGDDEMVVNELVPMEVKAGTAVILNQSVIHYSPPNNSTKVRKAITAGIKSEGAQMYFHYKVPDKNELEVFEMNDDFLISFTDFVNDIGKRPYLGKSIGFIPYKMPSLRGENLYIKLKEMKESAGFKMTPAVEVQNTIVETTSANKSTFRKIIEAIFN
ncbi:MAG: phytanoyl-CoA dioxygenase family protein [Chitinophagales bacterium]|nr:phytanoyl-CoA dioxygenase family protein [Chitinophagales bacterium]